MAPLYEGTLAYAEFDPQKGPIVRAWQGDLKVSDEELRKIAFHTLPSGEELESAFYVFTLTDSVACIAVYRRLLRSSTLTGSNMASICWLTEQTTNPLRFKPGLENILISLLRVHVTDSVLKQIYSLLSVNGVIDEKITPKAGPPVKIKARFITEKEIPEYFAEVTSELGKLF